jgi:nucleoid-associated protein YgaU
MLELSAYSNTEAQTKMIEAKLKKSIENVKKFKAKKNNEIKMLNAEIDELKLTINKLKRKHRQCQWSKKNAANRLTEQLNISESNFYIIYEENRKLKEALLKYQKKVEPETTAQVIEDASSQDETSTINNVIEPITVKHEWVEIVVENNMSIYELALQYYGKESEYTRIYRANKDVIPETLQLINGMSLKLPVTDNFQERPFILNQD